MRCTELTLFLLEMVQLASVWRATLTSQQNQKYNNNQLVMLKYILLTILALPNLLHAQVLNCTVNAGIGNGVFCAGDAIELDGNIAGNVVPGTLKWEKISGPACVLQYANQLQAKAIPSSAGMYTFKISATCAQGTAEQTVTHVVEPKDSPEAGPDQTVACYPAGGVVLTGFSIPPSGTLANWETSGGLGSVEGGVFKLFPGVCFSQPSCSIRRCRQF